MDKGDNKTREENECLGIITKANARWQVAKANTLGGKSKKDLIQRPKDNQNADACTADVSGLSYGPTTATKRETMGAWPEKCNN